MATEPDVRAITGRAPYPHLVREGVKTIWTVDRPTDWRSTLLVHAAKHQPTGAEHQDLPTWQQASVMLRACEAAGLSSRDPRYPTNFWPDPAKMPLGAVVAVARIADCVPILARDECLTGPGAWVGEFADEGNLPHQQGGLWLIGPSGLGHPNPRRIEHERPLGDFSPGRWALLLTDVRAIDPQPARGRPGLWTPDDELVAACMEGTKR